MGLFSTVRSTGSQRRDTEHVGEDGQVVVRLTVVPQWPAGLLEPDQPKVYS